MSSGCQCGPGCACGSQQGGPDGLADVDGDRAQHRRAPGDADRAAQLISTLQRAQNSAPHADGAGLVAAHDGLDTGQGDVQPVVRRN